MPMPITMAFKRITKKGMPVYRINLNTTEVLSYLEDGKTEVRIDIIPKEITGKDKKTGKLWHAVRYYTWATPKGELNGNSQEVLHNGQTNA